MMIGQDNVARLNRQRFDVIQTHLNIHVKHSSDKSIQNGVTYPLKQGKCLAQLLPCLPLKSGAILIKLWSRDKLFFAHAPRPCQ